MHESIYESKFCERNSVVTSLTPESLRTLPLAIIQSYAYKRREKSGFAGCVQFGVFVTVTRDRR